MDGGKHPSKCKRFQLVSIDIKRLNLSIFANIMLALIVLSSITKKGEIVAKMASHAIFQYNVLAIDDIHNTWTNMIIKMIILRLLGLGDNKERKKIGVARPEDRRSKLFGSGAPEEPTPWASEHPMKVGRTDAMVLWCRRESKPSQPIGTG